MSILLNLIEYSAIPLNPMQYTASAKAIKYNLHNTLFLFATLTAFCSLSIQAQSGQLFDFAGRPATVGYSATPLQKRNKKRTNAEQFLPLAEIVHKSDQPALPI